MKLLGLDIGTTTVSTVVVENGKVIESSTVETNAFLASPGPWEKIQDPDRIRVTAVGSVERMVERHPDIARIGLTGQMHGILYLDANGELLSPLYTWQDRRAELEVNGKSALAAMEDLTGYQLSSGYGMATHYYNLKTGLVPDTMKSFCTIHDYIAMELCGNTVPVTDVSDGGSLGLFDVRGGCFDEDALHRCGICAESVPHIAQNACIGSYKGKIPVYVAIGDNQASFLGAVDGKLDSMLVNVGTGSQFSVYSSEYLQCPGLETRPFPGGGYLIVGASICGGRAYALLENFYRSIAGYLSGNAQEACYEAMDRMLRSMERPDDLPVILPLFQGTRQEPNLRGMISGLSTENFTPVHFTWAMLEGIAAELYDMYCLYRKAGGQDMRLVGSGNGLRKNVHLQSTFARIFKKPLELSGNQEEAAFGAAKFAQSCP